VLSPQSLCPLSTLLYELWFATAPDISGAWSHSGPLSAYRINSIMLDIPIFENPEDVVPDRMLPEVELAGDFLVSHAMCNEAHDVLFPPRE
jgi:hypothetical protein